MMTHTTEGRCAVCGAGDAAVSYAGPVRRGVFGEFLPGRILRCPACGLEWLVADETLDLAQYRTGEYRERVGEAASPEHFFAAHDREQFEKVFRLRAVLTRGATVADVGCAGGAFLDFVGGFAGRTIAVEPAGFYHDSLRARGHEVHVTADTIPPADVDVATSFSVIEHVETPMAFLSSMRAMLKPGGLIVLSTPNRRDILIDHGPDAYKSFFYRQVHLFYFDAASLREALVRAGFVDVRIDHAHRFGFGNYVEWLCTGRPPGPAAGPLGDAFDATWRATLEAQGVSDYLYAIARNPGATG